MRHVAVVVLATCAAGGAIPKGFEHHFSCPFARLWLEHGEEKAAKMLGLDRPHASAAEPAADNVTRCALGPGVMGGGHQHAMSPGYSENCTGAPGRGSPYMWPMRWKARQENKYIPFGNNSVTDPTTGVIWNRHDKNWMRMDTFGAPDVLASTTLHMGNRMTYIMWDETGAKIKSCSWQEMPIGPIRPDWYLDARPAVAGIDLQYLGKEHVYFQGEPRLVRKWRKVDFVSTYFTMSMDEYPDASGIRWPLILNVPGERMGPDKLRKWWDHEVLAEDDIAPFMIADAFVAGGGNCSQASGGGPPGAGHSVPSALEQDGNAWRSVHWAASPYAPPPSPAPAPPATPPPAAGVYTCSVCRHVYNATPDGGGKPFEELPGSWTCPVCGAPKSAYKKTAAGVWSHE